MQSEDQWVLSNKRTAVAFIYINCPKDFLFQYKIIMGRFFSNIKYCSGIWAH